MIVVDRTSTFLGKLQNVYACRKEKIKLGGVSHDPMEPRDTSSRTRDPNDLKARTLFRF